VIYLDTSALVKLIRIEAESDTLADWLDERAEMRWITSALAEIELPRAIRTVAPEGLSAVPSVLARLDRFDIDPVIRSTAATFRTQHCARCTPYTWPPLKLPHRLHH
jgi:predicted nucleic acid-binding protein